MEKISLLVNEDFRNRIFSKKYIKRLGKLGEVNIYDRKDFSDADYVLNFVQDSDVIITSWQSPVISQEILEVCPNLKSVLHAAGTPKPIISDALIERNIRVTSSAIAIGEGVAETALGLAITACKGVYPLSRDTKNKMWNENAKKIVKDFYDIKVGIISAGFIGKHMIKLLKNFHVDILLYDPTLSREEIAEIGAVKAELNELLSECDVISVHAPSIPATANMLNADNLSLIKDGAVLINTSRGAIFNETELIKELKKGRFYACIDVTVTEPPAEDNELRYLDNVVLTPHIAGTVSNGLQRIALHVCEEAERLYKGEKMKTEVNFQSLCKMA